VITEVRDSERCELGTGEAADVRSDSPKDTVMEMATAVKSIAPETAGKDSHETLQSNEHRKRKRRSELPATTWALGDWRCRMHHAAQQ